MTDSKSVGSNTVRVRPPPSAPKKAGLCLNRHSPAFFGAGGANSHCAGRARMHDSACPKFRTMRNQQSKHDSTPPPRHISLSQTGIALLFWCWGANSHCAGKARMPTSNNLYNFLSNVLTNYNNILQNPFKFVILYQKNQNTKKAEGSKQHKQSGCRF